MRKLRVVETYRALPMREVALFGQQVRRQTAASAYVRDAAARVAPLAAALAAYEAVMQTATSPSPLHTLERRMARTAISTALHQLAQGLNLDYAGDEVALRSTGLTLATGTGPNARAHSDLAAPTHVGLRDSPRAGCLRLHFRRPAGAVQMLTRYTTVPGLPPEQWHVAVGGGRSRELGPFASGSEVWARVAGLASRTHEPVFSEVVSRFVQ